MKPFGSKELCKCLKKLAIRSSATCEDGIDASFAGQFSSFLAVKAKDLIPTIKKCLSSVFTETVLMYCTYKNIDFQSIKMAIVVQQMINAQKGGVIFTRDVFNHEKDRLIIEAAKGLGENVVSGLVDPHRVIFNKKSQKIIEGVIGFDKAVLSTKEARDLFEIALKIENCYKQAQDIEWAIYKGKIYILQTRPITQQ